MGWAGLRRTSILSRLELSVCDDFIANLVEVEELLSRAVKLDQEVGGSAQLAVALSLRLIRRCTYELCPLVGVAGHIRRRLRSSLVLVCNSSWVSTNKRVQSSGEARMAAYPPPLSSWAQRAC